jgi:hypothetical protein
LPSGVARISDTALALGLPNHSMSSCLMLIRHAEKPQGDERGVDAHGHEDANSLSIVGWQRAGALVPLFMPIHPNALDSSHLCTPRHLFAARPTDKHPSTRPRDTLRPLADALNLPIDERFSSDDPYHAAAILRTLEQPALVCWRREALPALADAVLGVPEAPSHWPEDCFDLVWVLERLRSRWHLVQVPQRLLVGDRTRGLVRRVRHVA